VCVCVCVCGHQVQFVAGMTHAAQSIYVACAFPLWMQWALIIYGASILALFVNFYFHSYIRPSTAAKAQVIAHCIRTVYGGLTGNNCRIISTYDCLNISKFLSLFDSQCICKLRLWLRLSVLVYCHMHDIWTVVFVGTVHFV